MALVTGSSGAPVVATIGLSEAETHHIARMGFPDYRGARAIEVAFSGDIDAPDGSPAIRAGLVLPLLGEDVPHSLLSVLTGESKRRFSEDDVTTLTEIVARTRPAITRALNLREPDVVPELDLLTACMTGAPSRRSSSVRSPGPAQRIARSSSCSSTSSG